MQANENDPLLDQTTLSAQLNGKVSESTLEKWRCTGDGPPFIKAGRKVFYRQSAVDAWLAARTIKHTQQVPGVAPVTCGSTQRRRR